MSLLSRFVSRVEYQSYDDFKQNFKIIVPQNFNFAFDVVDAYAKESPNKIALVWCNDRNEEKILSFRDLKILSDKAANFFQKYGVKKGDTVMLTLKSRWEFWICMVGLNKLGAISIPSTHMLKKKDFVYRIKKADLKMIVCIRENGVPDEIDGAHLELGDSHLVKALVGSQDQERKGWANFDRELEEATPNFSRPTLHQAQPDIQKWLSTTRLILWATS
jgi:acetyl-CoA synthetase